MDETGREVEIGWKIQNTGTLGIVTLPEKRTVVQVLPVSRRKLNDWIYTSTYPRVQVTVKPISF